jgi:hypothetical protein
MCDSVYARRRMRLTELVTPSNPLGAMARVKPVVVSDGGGHRELARDRVHQCNAGALAVCLKIVIATPADRARATVGVRLGGWVSH